MMTQEEYMDVLVMRRQGMSVKEIGEELGYHPATISNWVRNGGRNAEDAHLQPFQWCEVHCGDDDEDATGPFVQPLERR